MPLTVFLALAVIALALLFGTQERKDAKFVGPPAGGTAPGILGGIAGAGLAIIGLTLPMFCAFFFLLSAIACFGVLPAIIYPSFRIDTEPYHTSDISSLPL